MALAIDIETEDRSEERRGETLEAWKAKKFADLDPGNDHGPKKMMDKTLYHYAQDDKFSNLFGKLERAPSEKQLLSIIYKQVGPSGNSLLHVAASNGSKGVTELLALHFPFLITRKNFQGDTAVHLAARAGKVDIIKILVRRATYQAGTSDNADHLLKMKNERGNTPLHDAVIYGQANVARYLVSESPEVSHYQNKEQKCPLYLAVETSNTDEKKDDMLEILLEVTATNDDNLFATVLEGRSPAHAAVEQEKLAVLEKIADKRPDLIYVKDEGGENPLHIASSMGYLEGVKFLLQKFSDCAIESNQEGHHPIHVACKNGHVRVVEEMVKQWVNPTDFLSDKGQNILHVAAESGQATVVKYILENPELKALINEKDLDGNTPMHLAAMGGRPKAVFALARDERVDCKISNSENLIAFHAAVDEYERNDAMDFEMTSVNDKQCGSEHINDGKRRSTTTDSHMYYSRMGLVLSILYLYTDVKKISPPSRDDKKRIMRRRRSKPLTEEQFKSRIEALLVVAVLVAGATYAGAIQLPGGGSSSSSNDDIINSNNSTSSSSTPPNKYTKLSKETSRIYITFDAIALHTSLMAAIILCWAQCCGVNRGSSAVAVASYLIFLSFCFLGAAFAFAVRTATIKDPAIYWVYALAVFVTIFEVFLLAPLVYFNSLRVVYPFWSYITFFLILLFGRNFFIKILGGKMKK